jgi:hypothetical protein
VRENCVPSGRDEIIFNIRNACFARRHSSAGPSCGTQLILISLEGACCSPLCPKLTEGVAYPFISGNSSSGTELQAWKGVRYLLEVAFLEQENYDAISARNLPY